jgi:hypothetical protein
MPRTLPRSVKFEILDDAERWADPYESFDLFVAGIWFLHEQMFARYPNCELLKRIVRLGNWFESVQTLTDSDPSKLTGKQESFLYSEMNRLGTLGHSLWHLRQYLDAPAMRDELRELSQIGPADSSEDLRRMRCQGFLLLAAANLVIHGFNLEFIRRQNGRRTPDFFAIRDGNRFCCEATSKEPRRGEFSNLEFFWTKITETVDQKRSQLALPEYGNAVLIIDCTPIWSAFDPGDLPIGGELVYSIPRNLGGPRDGSVSCVRYDDSVHSRGLRRLEEHLRDTDIHTIILWRNWLELFDGGFRRHTAYRILGTIPGAPFWSYFGKQVLAFPGPKIRVEWD